jgi:hypothetical protein
MLQRIEAYYIFASSPNTGYYQEFIYPHEGPLPPGRVVYASIGLSTFSRSPSGGQGIDPSAIASIWDWTVYNPDGTQSTSRGDITTNGLGLNNCARISFALQVDNAVALAQITVFEFY